MTPVALRRAGPADAERLAMIGAATFFLAFAHDHPGDALVAHNASEHSPEHYRRALADPATAIWLAETPLGAPVGYTMLTAPAVDCPTGPRDLELKRLYVLPQWQGRGLARALVAAVEDEARARGAERLLLCVYTANTAAQAFYAKAGYADTGHGQHFMVGDVAFDDRIWARQLA